jgi:hypothetical protein
MTINIPGKSCRVLLNVVCFLHLEERASLFHGKVLPSNVDFINDFLKFIKDLIKMLLITHRALSAPVIL